MQECGEKYGKRNCLDKIGLGNCPGAINDQCVSNQSALGKPSEVLKILQKTHNGTNEIDERPFPMRL